VKKVLVNTGSNVSVMLVKLVIALVMTPVLVRNLGNYDYGIWEILGAVLGYMGLLDIGMKPTISRFAAKYRAEDAADRLRTLYATAWLFLLLIGVFALILFLAWGIYWPEVLSEQTERQFKYTLLLAIVGIQLFFVFPGFAAESLIEGFQEYYVKNNITIVNSVIGVSVVYIFITPENGLLLLAATNALGLAIKYVLYGMLLMRPRFGRLVPHPRFASWEMFRECALFGFKSFVQGVASRIQIGTDTLVIGYFLGPAMVPFYAIPANLISYIRNIGWTVTHAFMPLFATMHVQNREENTRQFYLDASRYVVGIMLPLGVGSGLLGGPFIGVWIGEQYTEMADIIILLLMLSAIMPFTNPFSTRYLTAIGAHGILAKLYPVVAFVNIVMSIILVHYWGIVGVAVGTVIPVVLVVPIVASVCCRHLGIALSSYIYSSIAPSLIPTLGMAICVYSFRHSLPLTSYTEILMAVIAGVAVYSVLFIILAMKTEEKRILRFMIGKILYRLTGNV